MDIARRLQAMPGVGPMTAMAVEAFAEPREAITVWMSGTILLPRQRQRYTSP